MKVSTIIILAIFTVLFVAFVIWLIAEIQIRVWLKYGEKFLLKKSDKLKKLDDEKERIKK